MIQVKKIAFNAMAIVVVGLVVVACGDDDLFTGEKVTNNAEKIFGVTIDPTHDWKMTQEVTANVTVNMGTGESYIVGVYDKNPMTYNDAVYYAKQSVSEGGTVSIPLTLPNATDIYYVAIHDSHNRYLVQQATVANSLLTAYFGDNSNAARSRVSSRRAIQPSFNFPSDADASKFLTDVPVGVEQLTQNVGRANNWIDETWTGDLNIWGAATEEGNWQDRSGGTLYIKGNCDFSNRNFYFDGNSELYLVKGATLTLGEYTGSGNLQQNTMIYIAEGAKLVAKGELKLNNGLHIYNHGTIEAPKLSTNSNSVLYNVGTVTVANKISVENDLSVIVNDGTITAADLNTAGSGKFQNNANITITGTTFVNSNNNAWVNNGQYHTGNFIYNAASDDVINNCKLTVDEDFNMNLGDNPGNGNFKMDAGSSVVTKYFNGGGNWGKNYSTGWSQFNGGPFYIYMGANSVFQVTETATMNATKADYGIYGPESGGYAVFQAKNIVAGKAEQGYEVTYGGKLAVVAEKHFAQGYSGAYPYIDFKGDYATIYADGKMPAVSIAPTACNPGFNPGDGTNDDSPVVYTYAFEDTFMGDYDMNDVVIQVWEDATNDTKLNVKLCCTGASYNLYVFLRVMTNGVPVDYEIFGGNEVHSVLNGTAGKYINTGTGDKFQTRDPYTTQINKPANYNAGTADFWVLSPVGEIHVGTINNTKQIGNAPYGVRIPKAWAWPNEWTPVSEAYSEFTNWAQNKETSKDWYLTPVEGKVRTR